MNLIGSLQAFLFSTSGKFQGFLSMTFTALKQMKLHSLVLKFAWTILAIVSVVASSLVLLVPAALLYLVVQLRLAVVRCFVTMIRDGAAEATRPSLWPHPVALRTTVLSINGHIDAGTLAQYLTDGVKWKNIFIEYPNLTRRIETIFGIDFWTRCIDFDVGKHIKQAPPHFHQNLVSPRNVKEYVSTLLHQTPIDENLPPWQLFVINGMERDIEKMTWLVLQAHHLLSDQVLSQEIHLKTHFEPWGSVESLPLLAAPSATRRLLHATLKNMVPHILQITRAISSVMKCLKNCGLRILSCVRNFKSIQHSTGAIELMKVSNNTSSRKEFVYVCCLVSISFISSVLCYSFKLVAHSLKDLLLLSSVCSYKAALAISVWLKRILKTRSPVENQIFEASVEIYWIIRALVSLPRLMMEELIDTWRAQPLEVWRGNRRPQSLQITWGDGIPLKLVDDIRSATGASFSSVLLTAASMAVTDVLKAAGVPRPTTLRCTVPVSTSASTSHSPPTLLPLDFPTGVSSSSECLSNVREALRCMRRYPERYLAATWLLKYGHDILPRSILLRLTHALTGRYPLLCSYVTGPKESVTLFGHAVVEVFHMRHPAYQAVLSLCVTSYRNSVTVGVQTADWTSPYAAVLPRSFESCISELAVNSGVRIQPKQQRSSVLPTFGLLAAPSLLLRSFRRRRKTPPLTPPSCGQPNFPDCHNVKQSFLWSGRAESIHGENILENVIAKERFFDHRRSCREEFHLERKNERSSTAARRQMRNCLRQQLEYGCRIASICEKRMQESTSEKLLSEVKLDVPEKLQNNLTTAKHSRNFNITDEIFLPSSGRTDFRIPERPSKSKVFEMLQLNETITFKSSTMPSI